MERENTHGGPPYRVTLERGSDGTYLVWVDDLPGCALRAPSRAEALQRLPAEIRSFLAWAGVAGVSAAIDVEVVEEADSTIEADEDTEVLVAADRQALTPDYWRWVGSLLDRSRTELLALVDEVTDKQLATRREGSERTIREEIEHIAFVEFMYACGRSICSRNKAYATSLAGHAVWPPSEWRRWPPTRPQR